MEMIYIDIQNIDLSIRFMLFNLIYIFYKIFPGIKTSEMIPLCIVNDILMFLKLYDSLTSGKYNIRHIIRFHDKISRSHFDRANFSILFRCHNNYRNKTKRLILFKILDKFKSVHYRHEQINKN